jgi:hypothetical protein
MSERARAQTPEGHRLTTIAADQGVYHDANVWMVHETT